jgi:hypothetical protein
MNYESKYLKYKKKYLTLKNQHGGEFKMGDIVYNMDGTLLGKIDFIDTGFIRVKDDSKTPPKTKVLNKSEENEKWKISKGLVETVIGLLSPSKEPIIQEKKTPIDLQKKYLFLVNDWVIDKFFIECGRFHAVVATSTDECIKLLKEKEKNVENHKRIEDQFRNFLNSKEHNKSMVQFYELKDTTEESRIVKDHTIP